VNGRFSLLRRPFYYTNVDVDPKDPEVVYVSNERFFKSTDGGRTFQTLRTPHGDNHGVWINPDNPDVFIQCNDGGANVTLNDGRTCGICATPDPGTADGRRAGPSVPTWRRAAIRCASASVRGAGRSRSK
jgi:hypothetical protein